MTDLSKPTEHDAREACLHAGMHPNEADVAVAEWAAHDHGPTGCGSCNLVTVSLKALRKELG